TYDSYWNHTCARDPNGNTSSISYDASNTFPRIVTNPLGHQTTTQYYGVDSVAADNGLYGQVKSVTDPNNAVVTRTYDVFGRRATVTQPDGLSTTTTYNSFGTVGSQHIQTDSSSPSLSSWTYFDGLGRAIKTNSTGTADTTTV